MMLMIEPPSTRDAPLVKPPPPKSAPPTALRGRALDRSGEEKAASRAAKSPKRAKSPGRSKSPGRAKSPGRSKSPGRAKSPGRGKRAKSPGAKKKDKRLCGNCHERKATHRATLVTGQVIKLCG